VALYSMDEIVLRKTEPQPVTFPGGAQLNVQELRLQMTSVPLAHPGLYEFRLIANHAQLGEAGTALLRVLPG
jgi:hypothetical protein